MSQVLKDRREKIAKGAAVEFAEHTITELKYVGLGTRYFVTKVQKHGTWIYGFYVGILPGAIVVWGDCGELLFSEVYEKRSSVGWLESALESEGYLLSKLSLVCKDGGDEFVPDLAYEHLIGLSLSDDEHERQVAEEIYAGWSGENSGEEWDMICYEEWGDSDFDRARDWKLGVLWIVEALKVFVRLYRERAVENEKPSRK